MEWDKHICGVSTLHCSEDDTNILSAKEAVSTILKLSNIPMFQSFKPKILLKQSISYAATGHFKFKTIYIPHTTTLKAELRIGRMIKQKEECTFFHPTPPQ